MTVGIVDDHDMFRDALGDMIGSMAGFVLGFVVASGEAALDRLDAAPVDLVVADLRLPGIDGLELTRRIVARSTAIRCLVLSGFDDHDRLAAALDAGASEYVVKGRPQELRAALLRVQASRYR